MSRTILVNLCDSLFGDQTVAVSSDDPVSVLSGHVHGLGKIRLLYRGSVIIPSFSFAYLGIDDGADVCVVRVNETATRTKRPDYFKHNMRKKRRLEMERVRSSGPLTGLMKWLAVPGLAAELARIADVAANARETDFPTRVISATSPAAGTVKVTSNFGTNVSGDVRRPSTDALPIVWK